MRILVTFVVLLWCGALALRADTHYVSLDGTNDVANGYNTWAGAATQIQWAVDVATNGETVLVTNGTYDTGATVAPGATVTNRVCITNAITLRSVNGPEVTIIQGSGAVEPYRRCVYMTNAATLTGFTLTNGYALGHGGGVFFYSTDGVVSNCVISGNKASGYGGGAGVYHGTLANCVISGNSMLGSWPHAGGVTAWNGGKVNNCMISGNSTPWDSGGVELYISTMRNCIVSNNYAGRNCSGVANSTWSAMYNCLVIGNIAVNDYGGVKCNRSSMYNCTVVSNTANDHGGVYISGDYNKMINCIVWGNSPTNVTDLGVSPGTTNIYNCTDPQLTGPTCGAGNIGANPIFVNTNAANYRLSANSPCINRGTNYSWMTDAADVRSMDLDGNRRIDRFSGRVDMGAYELAPKGSMFRMY